MDRTEQSYRLPETRTVEIELAGGIKTFQTYMAGDEVPTAYAREIGLTDDRYNAIKVKGGAKATDVGTSGTPGVDDAGGAPDSLNPPPAPQWFQDIVARAEKTGETVPALEPGETKATYLARTGLGGAS